MVFTDYNLKTLSKNGFVRLPKTWLNEVDLTTGDLVDIYIIKISGYISNVPLKEVLTIKDISIEIRRF